MNSNIFPFLFVAAAPFVFMPSIIAWLTRHPRKVLILVGNMVLWIIGFIAVRHVLDANSGFFVPIPLDLAGWMALLLLAIRKPASPPAQDP